MSRSRMVWQLVLLASTLAAQPALAQRPTLVVGRDAELVRQVSGALADREAEPASATYPSTWAKHAADYKQAQAQIASARAAYNKGDIETAWADITTALTTIERAFAGITDYQAVARAYLFQADLANARGDREKAEDSYLIAARFGGADLALDPATTSPLVIEGYSTARELLENSPTGGLSIVSKPEAAMVIVDGTGRGKTPLSLVLPAGPHLVSVEMEGYDVWATQVPVDPDNVRKVEVFLSPASPIDLAADYPTTIAMQGLAELDGAKDWLVVRSDSEGIRYTLLPAGAAAPANGGPVALDELSAAVDETAVQIAAATAKQPEPEVEEGLPAWVWIAGAAGSVAVLGAAAAVVAVVLWPDEPEPEYFSSFSK